MGAGIVFEKIPGMRFGTFGFSLFGLFSGLFIFRKLQIFNYLLFLWFSFSLSAWVGFVVGFNIFLLYERDEFGEYDDFDLRKIDNNIELDLGDKYLAARL